MTEEEAKAWIADHFGAPSIDRLSRFAELLLDENGRQNLISPSTMPVLWSRHLVDSAQLAPMGAAHGTWLDIGTGGGLPGLVLALLTDRPFWLIEPRRLRATFLQHCVDDFGLDGRVVVRPDKVESVRIKAATISARAVSSIDKLVMSARHCADPATIWVLPRGQSGAGEVHQLTMPQPATFHVKQSVSDPSASIVVATGIGA